MKAQECVLTPTLSVTVLITQLYIAYVGVSDQYPFLCFLHSYPYLLDLIPTYLCIIVNVVPV